MRTRQSPAKSKTGRFKRTNTIRASRKVIVDFPADLYAATEKATGQLSINRSTLIRSAVGEYLEKLQREELEKQLAEGYIANARQARETAEAFRHVNAELL